MSYMSLFSPYNGLPGDPADWIDDPPRLIGTVGWEQANDPEDVLLLERIVNILISNGYLEARAAVTLPENGSFDQELGLDLGFLEEEYLSGMASPLGPGIVGNDSPLFNFLVHMVAGNADLTVHYSHSLYELARIMLPGRPAAHNLTLYLGFILRALTLYGVSDTEMVLTAFATIRAETASVAPVSEGISHYNTSEAALNHQAGTHSFDLYDNAKRPGQRPGTRWSKLSRKRLCATYRQVPLQAICA